MSDNLLQEDYYKKVEYGSISEIQIKNYNSLRNSCEISLKQGKSYFFILHLPQTLQEMFMALLSHCKTLKIIKHRSHEFKAAKFQQQWLDSQLSNFEYLMKINTFSGRSYNDANQYPVFPWILTDFTSKALDFSQEKLIYRDLAKPIGALNEKRLNYLKQRMREMASDTVPLQKISSLRPFLYGSHYSSSAQVLHYLLRLQPVANLCLNLQSGRFDCADRLFFEIAEAWRSCLHFHSDFKELTPEFYSNAEFLRNRNRFSLGTTQNGLVVGDVILPSWAGSPEEFVFRNRQALESDYVSQRLNNWIDLIFGYKQQGEEALKADNVFFYMTYEVFCFFIIYSSSLKIFLF